MDPSSQQEGPWPRAEDGVELPDGTLIVADQRYGLAKIDTAGNVEPFGNFEAVACRS